MPARLLPVLTSLLIIAGSASAQPDSLWSLTFGGAGNDSLWEMIRTDDGGLALSGYQSSADNSTADGCIIKLDRDYHTEWNRTYGGPAWDAIYGVAQIPDSGYLAVGYTDRMPEQARRGGIIMTTDRQGEPTWVGYTYEYEYADARSCVITPNGRGAIGGIMYPGGNWHDDFAIWVGQLGGDLVWENHYGTANGSEFGMSIINTSDFGLALAGQRMVFGEHGVDSGSVMFVKVDADGRGQWLKNYTEDRSIAFAMQVVQTPDDGYALWGAIGYSWPDSGITDWDAWLIKTDVNGDVQWQRKFDTGRDEWGLGIIQTSDSGFVAVGIVGDNHEWEMRDADCFLTRFDSDGRVMWRETYGGAGVDVGMRVRETPDGGYIVGGMTSSIGAGGTDFWLLKTGRDPLNVGPGPLPPADFSLSEAYPNPFNGTTLLRFAVPQAGKVSLKVFDLQGKVVGSLLEGNVTAGEHEVKWDAGPAPAGIYFARLEAAGSSQAVKLLLVK